MASCVRNICTQNYQNLITVFQVKVKNVRDVSFETQCTCMSHLRDLISVIKQFTSLTMSCQ